VPPKGLSYLLATPFAVDRIDTWVSWFGGAIVLACAVGVGLWQMFAYLARKRPKRRAVRESPEPPAASQSPRLPPRVRGDDPEQLQQDCTALEDSLADMYIELAERWFGRGQPQKATAALKRIVQLFPGRRQAQAAQERLQQLGTDVENQPL